MNAFNVKDLTGRVIAGVRCLGFVGMKKEGASWAWECFCGAVFERYGYSVVRAEKVRGKTSCGCLHVESARALGLTKRRHGMTGKRLYYIYNNMLSRCQNVKSKSYNSYGARGISVCKKWQNRDNFFKWALTNGYNDTLTIERINVNKGYSPANCKWIPMAMQSQNTRHVRRFMFAGRRRTLLELSRFHGVPVSTIRARILRQGWSVWRAATTAPLKHG